MTAFHFDSPDHVLEAVNSGSEPPEHHSEWFEVDQRRIDAFAAATNDSQWIHVDRERAQAGPYGATIAHGYLTLSLIPFLTTGALDVSGAAAQLNYGLDRVRFISPVVVGSRIRATTRIAAAERAKNGVLVRLAVSMAIEGQPKPAAVAEQLVLIVPLAAASPAASELTE